MSEEFFNKALSNFVKDFANKKIDIKNIKKINEKENLDSYLKEIINIYLELQKLKEKINKKIIFYENLIKKYQKIKKDIENNESEVNEQINQINELIKKYSENNELYVNEMDKGIDELQSEYIVLIQDKLTEIGNKYNSGNVILLGSDIFSRIAISERNIDPDYFDEIISEKVDKIIADKIRTNKGLK